MTGTLSIITDAYRESNINGIGVVPDAKQQEEALRLLSNVVGSVYGFEVGEGLRDWPVGRVGMQPDFSSNWSESTWTRPKANVRLLINTAQPQTLFFPNDVSDGARIALVDVGQTLATYPVTLNGNGRTIDGEAAVVVSTDGVERIFLYRADRGGWVTMTQLDDVDAEFPFPAEFDAAFVTMLAMRLNPRYGRSLAAESINWMERSLRQLRARYRQKVKVPVDSALLRHSYTPKGYINRSLG